MGLNLTKLAEIAAAAKAVQTISQSPQTIIQAPQQVDKVTTLAALASLIAAPKVETIAAPELESAGTISYHLISNNIISLDAAIKGNHPSMPRLLQDIWTTLNKYPEQVTLLSEEDIEVVISGLEKLVDTDLAAITLKSATSSKKSKVPVSALSLGF